MIIITDTECEAVPGSGISERVIFPERRETLQIMYAAMIRLEQAEKLLEEERQTYLSMHKDNSALTTRIAELEALLTKAGLSWTV